ncbi:MAG: hypothetical protein AB7D51_01660, partial [Desulfovibrionaceae bacterium]
MPTNEILQFGTGGTVEDGDVLELAAYESLADRTNGHQPGIANRALANMVARQTAHMAAGLAQFIANRHAPGVVDDGDLDKVEAGLLAAIAAMIEAAADNTAYALEDHIHETADVVDLLSDPHVWTAQQTIPYSTLAYAATMNWNVAAAPTAVVTLEGNPAWAAPTNLADGG